MERQSLLKGRYRKGKKLGVGGMAITFKGIDTLEKRPVVIKEIKRELLHLPEFKERFKREITIQEGFRHKNIIKVLDRDLDSDRPFAVLEYAEKGDIGKLIKRSSAGIQLKLDWILQILEGETYPF